MPQITGTCPKCHQYSSWTEDDPCYKCVEQEEKQKRWEAFLESHKEQIEKFWYAMFDAIFPPDYMEKMPDFSKWRVSGDELDKNIKKEQ